MGWTRVLKNSKSSDWPESAVTPAAATTIRAITADMSFSFLLILHHRMRPCCYPQNDVEDAGRDPRAARGSRTDPPGRTQFHRAIADASHQATPPADHAGGARHFR